MIRGIASEYGELPVTRWRNAVPSEHPGLVENLLDRAAPDHEEHPHLRVCVANEFEHVSIQGHDVNALPPHSLQRTEYRSRRPPPIPARRQLPPSAPPQDLVEQIKLPQKRIRRGRAAL